MSCFRELIPLMIIPSFVFTFVFARLIWVWGDRVARR